MERDPDNRPIITPNDITDGELLSDSLERYPEKMGILLNQSKDSLSIKLRNVEKISDIVDFGWFYSDDFRKCFVSEFDKIINEICQGIELDSNTIIRRMATSLAEGTNSTVNSSNMIIAENNTLSMVTKALIFSESEAVEKELVKLRKDFRRRWNTIDPAWEYKYNNSLPKQVSVQKKSSCLQSVLTTLGITLIVILIVSYFTNFL